MTVELQHSLVYLAPMAGVTDQPMRKLVHSFGGGQLVSEMAAVNALSRAHAKTYRIIDVRDEKYPVIVQLVGGDSELFGDAARLAMDLGAAGIDINMGCPVRKIVANQSGSYLMTDIPRAAAIIKAVKRATDLPVSVKFRKGWDYQNINAVEFARMCEDCGAARITVHGRTRSEFYSGVADWDIIAEVKQAVKIPVIGNGDIDSPQKARDMLDYTRADGVMIGRAALGRPWLIAQVDEYLRNGKVTTEISSDVVKQTLSDHIDSLVAYYGERTALALSRKYVCWYVKGMREAKKFREIYVRIDNMAEAKTEINRFFAGIEEENQ